MFEMNSAAPTPFALRSAIHGPVPRAGRTAAVGLVLEIFRATSAPTAPQPL